MTLNEKLAALKHKCPTGRFFRIESFKDGRTIVSDYYDAQRITLLSAEKDVVRRTLVLVSLPFKVTITAVSPDGLKGGDVHPLPLEH